MKKTRVSSPDTEEVRLRFLERMALLRSRSTGNPSELQTTSNSKPSLASTSSPTTLKDSSPALEKQEPQSNASEIQSTLPLDAPSEEKPAEEFEGMCQGPEVEHGSVISEQPKKSRKPRKKKAETEGSELIVTDSIRSDLGVERINLGDAKVRAKFYADYRKNRGKGFKSSNFTFDGTVRCYTEVVRHHLDDPGFPYMLGREAYNLRKPHTACPFPEGFDRDEWKAGWARRFFDDPKNEFAIQECTTSKQWSELMNAAFRDNPDTPAIEGANGLVETQQEGMGSDPLPVSPVPAREEVGSAA